MNKNEGPVNDKTFKMYRKVFDKYEKINRQDNYSVFSMTFDNFRELKRI